VRVQTVSLEARAVRLLLQDPKQASLARPEALVEWGLGRDTLLVQLVELLHSRPGISTPALLGVWQGTEQGEQLAELAANEFLTPSTGVDREFQDVLRGLHLAAKEVQLQAATELETIARLKRDIEQLKRSG
jgi:hypothetical protein